MSAIEDSPVYVSLEFTPNPDTLKYSVNRTLLSSGSLSFDSAADAQEQSPLAHKLLTADGVSAVMLGTTFLTVTRAESGDWDQVHETCSKIIETHLSRNLPVLTEAALQNRTSSCKESQATDGDEQKIIQVINNEIRPAVAMDGGDIIFDRFADGVVYVHLKGACSGCPSSEMTLKNGIETRLKEVLPAVKSVVAV